MMPINDTCEGTVIKAMETDNDTKEFGKCSMKTVHPEIKEMPVFKNTSYM